MRPHPKRNALLRVGLVVAVLAGGLVVAWRLGLLSDPARLVAMIRAARDVAQIEAVFAGAFALGAAVGVPVTALTLVAGAIYGTWVGTALSMVGATGGSLLSYALSRTVAGEAVARVARRYTRYLERLERWQTFLAVARLRLMPIVPFVISSVASGLARVPLRWYVAGTAAGFLPIALLLTHFADTLIRGGRTRPALIVRIVLIVLALVALTFTPNLVRWHRRRSV